MWISEPTTVTTKSIALLRRSIVKPMETVKSAPKSSHRTGLGAKESGLKNKTQTPRNEIKTAPTEIMALTLRIRCVKSVMITALKSGARRMIHGRVMLEFHRIDVFDVRCVL